MDVINPLSLLELTMVENYNEDEDCIVIDDDDDDTTVDEIGGICNSIEERMEVEVDPLYIPTVESQDFDNNPNQMISLWINTNISNLATPSLAEIKYRKKKYKNIYGILKEKLHCTVCTDHIGCDIRVHSSSIEHPILKVLVCEKCLITYRNVQFVLNEKGKEAACRWCGKVSSSSWPQTILRSCQQCPFSFCEACLGYNCPDYTEPQFPWTCIACNIVALWSARATLWALNTIKNILLSCPQSTLSKVNQDISCCCRKKRFKRHQAIERRSGKISNVLDPVDIKRLVQPYTFNGSTVADFQNSPLPQPDTHSIFSELFSEMRNDRGKISKPKAKPKRKSSVKSLKDVSLNKNTVPLLSVPNKNQEETNNRGKHLNSTENKSNWLRTKLLGYTADFEQLRMRLNDIEKSLTDSDSITDEKIDSITTLLSLHVDLLNSCCLNLINEWKERKARAVLENFNLNKEINDKSKPTSKIIAKKSNQNKKSGKDNGCKGNRSSSRKNENIIFNGVNLEGNKNHVIKDCCVRLHKLKMPLPIFDKECVIKLERIDSNEEYNY